LITVLAGGTGSVKLVRGIAAALKTDDMNVICNVGDNIWIYGLYVCPDIDTITYGLAGLLDRHRGWGVMGDSFKCIEQLKRIGVASWFGLGDRDLATHLLRTNMMKEGMSLSEVTDWMRNQYSVAARIVPATDQQVSTKIRTNKGEMHLQEFWVRQRGRPKVTGVRYDGAEKAAGSRIAIEVIKQSDVVIVAPANPISSIGPIVALAPIKKELAKKRDKVTAVSPLVGDKAVSGPAAKYMKALKLEISPVGVARYYRDWVGTFVISKSDHGMAATIQALGMEVYETNITMKSSQDEVRLGRYLLNITARGNN
jgi:LPPG:FO 2-phospho-L-lactate transferase